MKRRRSGFVIGALFWAFLSLNVNAQENQLLEGPFATIAGQESKRYSSIQEALDAAPSGAEIQLSAGRFNERVTLTKPVTLMGAGPNKTVLGPSEQEQRESWDLAMQASEEIDDIMRAAEQSRPKRELTDDETETLKRKYAKVQQLAEQCLRPVVLITDCKQVTLRSLRVTMPLTPHEGSGLQVTAAVKLKHADGQLIGCAIVGCLSNGVDAERNSQIELRDSLVAACWGTGVSSSDAETKVLIKNSDIRNNYHYNMGLRSDSCVIEGCRISGTAWSGLSCGGVAPRIERNVIFNNSNGIYAAGSKGVVRHNLIYNNQVGASCWSSSRPKYEGNVFLENDRFAFAISGPAEPKLRGNLIVGSSIGVMYRPMGITGGEKPAATEFFLEDNVFWKVETPVVLRRSRSDDSQDEPLALVGQDGNRLADPQATIDDAQQLAIGNDALISELNIEELLGISLRSSWPIMPEELAMIPDDGTVDSSKWKKLPKLRAKY